MASELLLGNPNIGECDLSFSAHHVVLLNVPNASTLTVVVQLLRDRMSPRCNASASLRAVRAPWRVLKRADAGAQEWRIHFVGGA